MIGARLPSLAQALAGSVVIAGTKDTSCARRSSAPRIHEGFAEISLAVAGADLIYMRLPVGQTSNYCRKSRVWLSPDALAPMRRAPSDRSARWRRISSEREAHIFSGDIQWQGKEVSGIAASRGGIVSWIEYALIRTADDKDAGKDTLSRVAGNLSR